MRVAVLVLLEYNYSIENMKNLTIYFILLFLLVEMVKGPAVNSLNGKELSVVIGQVRFSNALSQDDTKYD